MNTSSSIGALAALLVLFALGCNGSAKVSRPDTLDHSSWRLVGWTVSSLDPDDFEITLDISGDGVAGKSAVNRYFGPIERSADGTFRVGMLGSTMMAGPEPAMQAEQEFLRLLPEARRWEMVNHELLLFDEDGSHIMTFRPAP